MGIIVLIFQVESLHCQKCNTFFEHMLFTYENEPKSTNSLLWVLEKILNCIGALKHHLLPQAEGQHRIPEKRIASNDGRFYWTMSNLLLLLESAKIWVYKSELMNVSQWFSTGTR